MLGLRLKAKIFGLDLEAHGLGLAVRGVSLATQGLGLEVETLLRYATFSMVVCKFSAEDNKPL